MAAGSHSSGTRPHVSVVLSILTSRQYLALRLYYADGLSYRRIGKIVGSNPGTVWRLVRMGRQRVLRMAANETGNGTPSIEGLMRPSALSTPTWTATRTAAERQERLLDLLEERIADRDDELTALEQCMASERSSPTQHKRNTFDQWELDYMLRSGRTHPCYEARRLLAYCNGNGSHALQAQECLPCLPSPRLH